ncbi:MAG TPA: 16S rRNA (cytosine(1402)-N(4))-methyltransferase, partial [bacterium]|nr:16S rRNA (cytosine(1402)-N(4))-methyltransferase [bacterium]
MRLSCDLKADSVHLPVLLRETVEWLSPPPDGIVVDLTVGMGGHSAELLKQIPNGRLIGLDQDVEALQHAGLALQGDP